MPAFSKVKTSIFKSSTSFGKANDCDPSLDSFGSKTDIWSLTHASNNSYHISINAFGYFFEYENWNAYILEFKPVSNKHFKNLIRDEKSGRFYSHIGKKSRCRNVGTSYNNYFFARSFLTSSLVIADALLPKLPRM